eukprot:204529-Hanusia_phi.AAC.1
MTRTVSATREEQKKTAILNPQNSANAALPSQPDPVRACSISGTVMILRLRTCLLKIDSDLYGGFPGVRLPRLCFPSGLYSANPRRLNGPGLTVSVAT